HERRPLSWVLDEEGVPRKLKTSQRDLRTAERIKATELAEPTTVGEAPLSKDRLGKKRTG
ncbi:MAG: hypothetical protein P8Y95_13110, partial [Gammaproteobacteria bacterium]